MERTYKNKKEFGEVMVVMQKSTDDMLWLRRPVNDKSLDELTRSVDYLERRLLDYRWNASVRTPIIGTYQKHIAECEKRQLDKEVTRMNEFLEKYLRLYKV